MKKVIKMMMMMLVASTFVLTSCKDDDGTTDSTTDVKLTLNPAASSGTHFVGDTIKITLNGLGNSDNKLKSLTITKAPEGKPTEELVKDKLSGTDKIYNFEYVTTLADTGKITFTFKLEGDKNTETKTYLATIEKTGAWDEMTSVELFDVRTSSSDIFARLSNPYTRFAVDVTLDQWKEQVDVAYFDGTTNKRTITSPSNVDDLKQLLGGLEAGGYYAAGVPRTTGFYKVSAAERSIYTEVKTDPNGDDRKLIAFASGKSYASKVSLLDPGDVILYKTKDGVLGLISVGNVSGAASDSRIVFNLIAQVK
jgi:hypothetical protein